MAAFNDAVTEAKCQGLHAVVEGVSNKFLCFTRLDDTILRLSVSDGYDVWKVDLDADEMEALTEAAGVITEAYLSKIRTAFQVADMTVSQMGVKCNISLGHGAKSLDFELYEAKAVQKKTELQSILFRLASKATECEKELATANATISSLRQHKAGAKTGGSGLLNVGDGPQQKGQPKAVPNQAAMSVVNPGSRKRKAARGVMYD